MLIFSIVLIIAVAVVLIVVTFINNRNRAEMQKYYNAAGNILKENYLDYSLQNPFDNRNIEKPNSCKLMICLKLKGSKDKLGFVFDPEKSVYIGRDCNRCNIYINEVSVSQQHCCIYSNENGIVLKDMDSTNGTTVRRGLYKRYFVTNSNEIELKSNDKIIVGSNTFKIILFYYDMAVM